MDPSEFAAEELDLWQDALREHHEAHQMAQEAQRAGNHRRLAELLPIVEKLRVVADLKLAEAVSLKCSYRQSLWSKLNRLR